MKIGSIVLFTILFSQIGLAQFTVSPSLEKDFGTFNEGIQASHTFIIKNTSNLPARITNVKPACGCTTAEPSKRDLAPGDSAELPVVYDSKGRPGPFYKTIEVTIESKSTHKLELALKGTVDPGPSAKLTMNSPRLELGDVNLNQLITAKLQIKNDGEKDLVIDALNIKRVNVLQKPLVIAPKTIFNYSVNLPALTSEGTITEYIEFRTNDPKQPRLFYPVIMTGKK